MVTFVLISALIALAANPAAALIDALVLRHKRKQPVKPAEFWG